jgi:hypothetical protein
MRPSLQALMKKIKRKTVFIIGGGPSAMDVDFSILQNELVVCINDAYRDFPDATAIYWVDDSWGANNYDNLVAHNCNLIFTSRPAHHISYLRNPDPTTVCNTYMLKRTGEHGFNPTPDCLMGNNSGVQVLNLIVNMKPETIVLIGYDMRTVVVGKKTRSHYHDEERPPIGEHIYTDLFTPSMKALAKGMKELGSKVRIINANPESAVRCFEFGDYTTFLKQ